MRLSLVAALIFLAPVGLSAQAEQRFPYKARVNAADAYVRSGPGKTFYPTGKLDIGDEVEVYRHASGGWCAIRPPEGSFSWISERNLELTEDGLAKVTNDRVATRIGSEFSSIGDATGVALDRGELVQTIGSERFRSQPEPGVWYKVAPPAGEFRWICREHLSRAPRVDGVGETSHGGAGPHRASAEPAVYHQEGHSAPPIPAGHVVATDQEASTRPDGVLPAQCYVDGSSAVCDSPGCWIEGPYASQGGCHHAQPPMRGIRTGRLGTLWVRGDYLLWWIQGFSTPPLVTTSSAADLGVLGEPTTTVLAGDARLAGDATSGLRASAGYWIDPCMTTGVFAVYTGLGAATTDFSASSDGGVMDPLLARPFFNVEAGHEGPDAEPVAFPEEWAGRVAVHAESTLHGLEVLVRRAVAQECWYRIDFLGGWRYNRLHDTLRITDFKESLGGPNVVGVGTTFEELDLFETANSFNGAEFGVMGEIRRNRWVLEGAAKLALGCTRSKATIDGSTKITVPGGPPGVDKTRVGLLALDTNIGLYEQNEFAVIPELSIVVGYDLTRRLRAMIGYTFIYWSRVARAGDQIDFDLNLTQLDAGGLVGNPRPQFAWVMDDMWAQGLNFGLDYRF